MLPRREIAYYSLEIGLEPRMHTNAGGLGLLAGDTLRAAADLSVPMVGVTLLYREGHFRQTPFNSEGAEAQPDAWAPESALREMAPRVGLPLDGRMVMVRAWRLVAGADVWLNNPRPPLEASGTSGMKAAINGVPSLSTLDGWWREGCVENLTGWSIGEWEDDVSRVGEHELDARHARGLDDTLEHRVPPTFYGETDRGGHVMRACIAINGAHFTTQRMVREYAVAAYGDQG